MTKDLTEGKPLKLIISFAMPLFLGNLLQQLYNFIDTMIVGHFLGVDALAGVGATGSINFLIVGFCMGVCNGFVIPIAQKFGARDYKTMRCYFANSIYLSIGFATVITLVVCIFCKKILILMGTPENIIEYSYTYIFIIFAGIPATFAYNILAGVIRSVGDSKTPLIFLAVSSVINIGLDCLFIATFKLGIAGAAYATILSQIMSGILCLIMIVKKFDVLQICKDEWRKNTFYMRQLCGMGVPMGLQYSVTAIGSVLLQTSINSLGSLAVASVTASNKISMILCAPIDAMGSTMATYGGQNIGAKKLDRIRTGLKDCCLLGVGYSFIAFAIVYFFSDKVIELFVSNPDPLMISQSRAFLIWVVAFYILLAFVNIFRFLIQGIGFPTFAILAGVLEMIARTLAALVLVPLLGFTGVCMASPLAWIFADAFLIPAYFYVMKKVEIRMNYRANIINDREY